MLRLQCVCYGFVLGLAVNKVNCRWDSLLFERVFCVSAAITCCELLIKSLFQYYSFGLALLPSSLVAFFVVFIYYVIRGSLVSRFSVP